MRFTSKVLPTILLISLRQDPQPAPAPRLSVSSIIVAVGFSCKNFFNSIYKSGLPGFMGGLILSLGYCGYVFTMYNTTVANTNFIIQTQTIFLAIFGYLFLNLSTQ